MSDDNFEIFVTVDRNLPYQQILSKMKNKSTELDVDFIGGQGPLTKREEKAISEFIKTQKLLRAKKKNRRTSTAARTRVTV